MLLVFWKDVRNTEKFLIFLCPLASKFKDNKDFVLRKQNIRLDNIISGTRGMKNFDSSRGEINKT